MYPRPMNRLLVGSLATACGGILACFGALLDLFLPKGSALAFGAWMVLLAIAVLGVAVGFLWLCDKCDDPNPNPIDRALRERQRNRRTVKTSREPNGDQYAGGPVDRALPVADRPYREYLRNARGFATPKNFTAASARSSVRHGQ